MKLIDKIKKWFNVSTEENQSQELKTIQTLSVFDDVWLVINNKIHKGWVWEKTKNSIVVIYDSLNEFRIRYTRPLSQRIIEYNNVTLILNEADTESYKTFENNNNT